jgi:hypothetical protein
MKKLEYNITRFDGGMTDNIRQNDLSKCAFVSHFDIYADPNRLIPMPGYVDDMHDGSTATGMKQYDIRAFAYSNGLLYAVGNKADGTGSKNFEKNSPETASWTATVTGEGTYDIYDKTFLRRVGSRRWYATTNGGNTYISYWNPTVTDAAATLETFVIDDKLIVEHAFDDNVYINTGTDDAVRINTTSVTDPAKDTAIYINDIHSGDEQIGLFGHRFYPFRAQLLLWDSASSLADQKIEFGKGRGTVLGNPAGVWVGVVNENVTETGGPFDEEANGDYAFSIKYAAAGGARTLFRMTAPTNSNGVLMPTRASYKGAMLFYGRIPQDETPTTYKQGIFAVGKTRENSPLAVSLLLDTTSLGLVENYYSFGHHHYFAHNEDGSISRLDTPTGTYDVTAVYETLMFGSSSPHEKQLGGISVHTEDLPASATVTVKYRTDEHDDWTELGSSAVDGTQIHSFTSDTLGSFQEIQFRVEVLGNAPVKNVYICLNELDTTPYDA